MNQRKPWLPTAILGGIAVLLAAFAIWIVPLLGKPSESDNVQPTPIAFFEFGGGDIVRISVTKGFLMTTVVLTWSMGAVAYSFFGTRAYNEPPPKILVGSSSKGYDPRQDKL